jgi:hypothetical protein
MNGGATDEKLACRWTIPAGGGVPMNRAETAVTMGELITCWTGECLMQLTNTFVTWVSAFPMVHVDDLAAKQISPATARAVLQQEGFGQVTDVAQGKVIKYLGGGAVIWVEADTRVTVWAPQVTREFATRNPVILGFPPPPGGLPAETEVQADTLPPVDYGRLAMPYGGAILTLDPLGTEGEQVQGVLRDLVAHLDQARDRQQGEIEAELWAVYGM